MKILFSLIALSSLVLLAGCGKTEVTPTVVEDTPSDTKVEAAADNIVPVSGVQKGNTISVRYTGKLEDGEVFDTNVIEDAKAADIYNELRPYDLLTFNVGAGQMIPGFDTGVIGMEVGEAKTLTIPADEAYGEVRVDLIKTYPISTFEEEGVDRQAWEVGETYNFDRLRGTIVSKDEENIIIDFNHFLAGKTLMFDITVEEIK